MIVKRDLCHLLVALLIMVGLCGCNKWLSENEPQQEVSVLTEDVEFVAQSVTAHRNSGIYAEYKGMENFFFEFVGEQRGGVCDVMILDLLAPSGTTTPVGTFTVGYSGNYIALSRYDVKDEISGLFYTGGCFYGEARDNFMTNYFGFLTEGEVVITLTEEGEYRVEVDAKSVVPTIKMTYTGEITFKQADSEGKASEEQ